MIDPAPVPAPAPVPVPVAESRGWRPRYPRWLIPAVGALFLAATVVCCLAAARAAHRADEVENWHYTVGVIVDHPYDDQRGPGVVYYDERGRQRVMWLAPGDTADMPAGAIGTIAYQEHGPQAEFRFLPRQREHVYESLAAVMASGMLAAGAWWLGDRRARARNRPAPTDVDLLAAG